MRILIIDDQKEIVDFLKKGLESVCFAVDAAMDGEQGSYLAMTNDYDLIVLDNNLPKKNGKEIAREIRDEGKNTPIIMLSVHSDISTKVDLLNLGVDDYVTKPFSFDELLARIKALLRRPPKIEDEILQVGSLTLDTKRHAVRRDDKEIYLTKKEFMLLEYLMRNNGVVLSRSMILEHVWDMNADPFSNTIESHILSLRKKIDTGCKKKFILTVPGIGYKMEV